MSVEDFYKRSKEKLIRKILPIVKNRDVAEDLFHDAIVKALEKYDTYDPSRSKEETWFTAILFNQVWDWKRSFKRAPEIVDLELEEFIDESIVVHDVEIPIEIVNQFHKRIFYLRFVLGYKTQEIAYLLKSNPENIKKILQRLKREV